MGETTKEITISLNILERLQIHAFLPIQGDFLELTIKDDIEKKVTFSQEELDKFKMVPTPAGDGTVNWNWDNQKEEEKKVAFTDLEMNLVQKNIKKADDEKKLTSEQLSLYKKFVQDN